MISRFHASTPSPANTPRLIFLQCQHMRIYLFFSEFDLCCLLTTISCQDLTFAKPDHMCLLDRFLASKGLSSGIGPNGDSWKKHFVNPTQRPRHSVQMVKSGASYLDPKAIEYLQTVHCGLGNTTKRHIPLSLVTPCPKPRCLYRVLDDTKIVALIELFKEITKGYRS